MKIVNVSLVAVALCARSAFARLEGSGTQAKDLDGFEHRVLNPIDPLDYATCKDIAATQPDLPSPDSCPNSSKETTNNNVLNKNPIDGSLSCPPLECIPVLTGGMSIETDVFEIEGNQYKCEMSCDLLEIDGHQFCTMPQGHREMCTFLGGLNPDKVPTKINLDSGKVCYKGSGAQVVEMHDGQVMDTCEANIGRMKTQVAWTKVNSSPSQGALCGDGENLRFEKAFLQRRVNDIRGVAFNANDGYEYRCEWLKTIDHVNFYIDFEHYTGFAPCDAHQNCW